MAELAQLVLATSLDEQIEAVATMASVALALLMLFTTVRSQRLKDDTKQGLGGLDKDAFTALTVDLALALVIFGGCAAMWLLFTASFSLGQWADRAHALRSMFTVLYITFVGLLLYQLSLFGRRLTKNAKNSIDTRKRAREHPPRGER